MGAPPKIAAGAGTGAAAGSGPGRRGRGSVNGGVGVHACVFFRRRLSRRRRRAFLLKLHRLLLDQRPLPHSLLPLIFQLTLELLRPAHLIGRRRLRLRPHELHRLLHLPLLLLQGVVVQVAFESKL
jgi:hypothetical protein